MPASGLAPSFLRIVLPVNGYTSPVGSQRLSEAVSASFPDAPTFSRTFLVAHRRKSSPVLGIIHCRE